MVLKIDSPFICCMYYCPFVVNKIKQQANKLNFNKLGWLIRIDMKHEALMFNNQIKADQVENSNCKKVALTNIASDVYNMMTIYMSLTYGY